MKSSCSHQMKPSVYRLFISLQLMSQTCHTATVFLFIISVTCCWRKFSISMHHSRIVTAVVNCKLLHCVFLTAVHGTASGRIFKVFSPTALLAPSSCSQPACYIVYFMYMSNSYCWWLFVYSTNTWKILSFQKAYQLCLKSVSRKSVYLVFILSPDLQM